jgi:hypothetical protein
MRTIETRLEQVGAIMSVTLLLFCWVSFCLFAVAFTGVLCAVYWCGYRCQSFYGSKKYLFDVSKGVLVILFRQLIYVQQSSNALPRDQSLMKKRACT